MNDTPLKGLPPRVTVVEVGPRDGLQNEKGVIATADKIQFIDLLSEAGFPVIEATSFVSPKAIPQLADAAEVMAGITRRSGVRYTALVPNVKGMERALAAGLRGGRLHWRLGDIRPAQHQYECRRQHRELPPGAGDGARGGRPRARLHLHRVRLPL